MKILSAFEIPMMAAYRSADSGKRIATGRSLSNATVDSRDAILEASALSSA